MSEYAPVPNGRQDTRGARWHARHLPVRAFHVGTIVQLVSERRKRPKTSDGSRNTTSQTHLHKLLTIRFENSTSGARAAPAGCAQGRQLPWQEQHTEGQGAA